MTYATKHTPGPWKWDNITGMVETAMPNLSNEYKHICDLRLNLRMQYHNGNAHLIAAAPAMYEALTILVELLEERGLYPLNVDDARQALAQAEGR